MALLEFEQLEVHPHGFYNQPQQHDFGDVTDANYQLFQAMQNGVAQNVGLFTRARNWFRPLELTSESVYYDMEGASEHVPQRIKAWLGRTAGRNTVHLYLQLEHSGSILGLEDQWRASDDPVIRARTGEGIVDFPVKHHGFIDKELIDGCIPPDPQVEHTGKAAETVKLILLANEDRDSRARSRRRQQTVVNPEAEAA